jgi:predicted lipoprotein with Yx(FWY)xxD motif
VRKSLAMLIAPALALVISGCGSSATTTTTTSTSAAAPATSSTTAKAAVEISTKTVPGLGAVLVNGQGRTLYVFAPDKAKKVTCVGACASIWPPLALSASQKPAVSGQAKSSLVASDPNPSGGRVATYAGWPLYTYVTDASSGTAKGQALKLNGGVWYVISPSGTVIHTKPSTGAPGY